MDKMLTLNWSHSDNRINHNSYDHSLIISCLFLLYTQVWGHETWNTYKDGNTVFMYPHKVNCQIIYIYLWFQLWLCKQLVSRSHPNAGTSGEIPNLIYRHIGGILIPLTNVNPRWFYLALVIQKIQLSFRMKPDMIRTHTNAPVPKRIP